MERGRQIADTLHKVISHHARGLRYPQLMEIAALHSQFGLFRCLEVGRWRAKQVAHIPEESDIIVDVLLGRLDPKLGQLEPHVVAAEGGDGVDGVEGVDWDPVLTDVVVFGFPLAQLEDSLADGGMEESDADCCDVPVASGLDGGEAMGDLDKPLEGLE